MNQPSRFEKIVSALRIFFALTGAAAVGLFAYLGNFIRPIGDDYCLSARLLKLNVIDATIRKYLTISNRFSNQFVVALSDLFGARGVAYLSVFTILLWIVTLMLLLNELGKLLRLRWNFWTALLLAELIAMVSFYTAPNLFQSIYWRPGMMTYFLPLVLFTLVFTAILRGVRLNITGRTLWIWMLVLLLAAFFIGGLSETVGMLHLGVLGLAWIAVWLWNKGPSRRTALMLISAALLGAFAALLSMFLTPANALRLEDTAVPPSPLIVIERAFLFAWQFMREAARLLYQPLTFSLIAGFLLAFFHFKFHADDVPTPRRAWVGLILIPLLTYLLTVATFAPSAYGQSYPVERVRFPTHVLLTMSLLLEGGLLGWLASRWSLPRWTMALPLVVLVLASFYPLWVVRRSADMVGEYSARAARWDTRDAQIREMAAQGERKLVVPQLAGIEHVKELDTDPEMWVNRCAARYYGVRSISAPQDYNLAP